MAKYLKLKTWFQASMLHQCIHGVEVLQYRIWGNWRDKFFNERKDKYQIKDYLSESGALSNKNDKHGVKRRKHAQTYYNSVKIVINWQR